MYRFVKDKRDYIFMLPYETDIVENEDEDDSEINSQSVDSSPSETIQIQRPTRAKPDHRRGS